MSHPVVLHLYDLSNGLARQMSQMLIGKTIGTRDALLNPVNALNRCDVSWVADGIWHTGVHVYGKWVFPCE